RHAGVDPRTAARQLEQAGAIRKSKGGGRWRLTGHDRLLRELPVLVRGESAFRNIPITNGREARAAGRWLEALADVATLGQTAPPATITDARTGRKLVLENRPGRITEAMHRWGDALKDWMQRGGGSGPGTRPMAQRFEVEESDLAELPEDELDELQAELEAGEQEREQ
ncbi:MAG: hypothetical protein ACYDAG_14060, partial [Chloroflexota bacterium]